MQGILQYPGSKRTLAPKVAQILGRNGPPEVYAEPFLGSGAVFFEAQRSWGASVRCVLSDACGPLMNVWGAIQSDPQGVAEALREILSQDVTEDYYNHQRALFNGRERLGPFGDSFTVRAARALWLNKACFNGLWRFSARSGFNVPWGKRSTVRGLPSLANLRALSSALEGVFLKSGHWREVLPRLQGSREGAYTGIYLDPPYTPSDTSAAKKAFVSYGAPGPAWTFADTIALVEWCEARARFGGLRVVLSYLDDPLLVPVLQTGGWTVEYVEMPRTISRNGAERKPVREILATLG